MRTYTKRTLRSWLKGKRAAVSNRAMRSSQICAHLYRWIQRSEPSSVALYFPLYSEPDLRSLRQRLATSTQILLPRIQTTAKGTDLLEFALWPPDIQLIPNRFGVSEPPKSLVPQIPACILVPGLGFTRQGHRMGYGGGYYDRTLSTYRDATPNSPCHPVCIGVTFDALMVARLPLETHDQSMDYVCTESGIKRCHQNGLIRSKMQRRAFQKGLQEQSGVT